MKTTLAKDDIERKWYVIDAAGKTLGKLAVLIANLLRGRNKPIFTPHMDAGDYVVVINAELVEVSGKKEDQKEYMFYTGYFGNEKYIPYKRMKEKNPEFIIEHAVKGMLPKNNLSRHMMKKLRIFRGSKHTHEAQSPIPVNF